MSGLRVHLVSDLHLQTDTYHPKEVDADVIVLAGDIGSPMQALSFASRHYAGKPVIYVAGNHEFHGSSCQSTYAMLRKAAHGTHIHPLEQRSVVIGGVRFLGSTLWTDFCLGGDDADTAMATANAALPDFRDRIRLESSANSFRAEHARQLHVEARAWLQHMLAVPFQGPTVVVTHHAPSIYSVQPRYRRHPLAAAYASSLEALACQADVWMHGHTHHAVDYRIGKCRVVSNPRGYHCEGTGFNPELVIDLDQPWDVPARNRWRSRDISHTSTRATYHRSWC